MGLINETDNLVEELYIKGATNNERLQELLWHLKTIAELSDEELGIAESDPANVKGFFIGYLTRLANKFISTEISESAIQKNNLVNLIQNYRVDITGLTNELHTLMELKEDYKTQLAILNKIKKCANNSLIEIQLRVEDN